MSSFIKVITGPMKSRKTLDLIVQLMEAEIYFKNVFAFYPKGSSRWKDGEIVSRLKTSPKGQLGETHCLSYPAIGVDKNLKDFLGNLPKNTDLVAFDDAHFFGMEITSVARQLRKQGIDVLVAGLDMDSFQQPFGPMPYLMAIADEVIKHKTFCNDCHEPASVSYRLVPSMEQELIGDKEYITVCFDCWHERKELENETILNLE